jgi:hypothetical protein
VGNFMVIVVCTGVNDSRAKTLGQYWTLKVAFGMRFESWRIAANRVWHGLPTVWNTVIEGFRVLVCHYHGDRDI